MGPEETVTPQRASDAEWRVFDAIARGRRAVREFSSEAVSERDMNELLDAAILAPTSSNLQAYELVWVRSSHARRKLVDACMKQSAAKTAAELVVCLARWDECDETRRELAEKLRDEEAPRDVRFYYEHLIPMVYRQGPLDLYGRIRRAAAAPVLLFKPLPRGPASLDDVRVWAVKSAALVCENLMLAARAKGLDTCPMEGCDPVRVGKIVGLRRAQWKKTWDLTMVIAIGHRAKDSKIGPQWRRERHAIVREL